MIKTEITLDSIKGNGLKLFGNRKAKFVTVLSRDWT